jgi:hypothetical protein
VRKLVKTSHGPQRPEKRCFCGTHVVSDNTSKRLKHGQMLTKRGEKPWNGGGIEWEGTTLTIKSPQSADNPGREGKK